MAISCFLWFAHSHAELLTWKGTVLQGPDGEHFSQGSCASKYHLPCCLHTAGKGCFVAAYCRGTSFNLFLLQHMVCNARNRNLVTPLMLLNPKQQQAAEAGCSLVPVLLGFSPGML